MSSIFTVQNVWHSLRVKCSTGYAFSYFCPSPPPLLACYTDHISFSSSRYSSTSMSEFPAQVYQRSWTEMKYKGSFEGWQDCNKFMPNFAFCFLAVIWALISWRKVPRVRLIEFYKIVSSSFADFPAQRLNGGINLASEFDCFITFKAVGYYHGSITPSITLRFGLHILILYLYHINEFNERALLGIKNEFIHIPNFVNKKEWLLQFDVRQLLNHFAGYSFLCEITELTQPSLHPTSAVLLVSPSKWPLNCSYNMNISFPLCAFVL